MTEDPNADSISVTAIALTTTLLPPNQTGITITNDMTMQQLIESVDGLIVEALSFYATSLKIRPSIRLVNMTQDEIAANTGASMDYKWVELVLPKGFSLALPDQEHWKMLGFVQPNLLSILTGRAISKAISNDKDQAVISEKVMTVRSAMPILPSTTVESEFIRYRVLIKKERSLPEHLRNLKIGLEWSPLNKIRFKVHFPRDRIRYSKSPSYLALVLRNIMDVICEIFGFDPDLFVQIEKFADKLIMASLSEEPTSPEFKIKLSFSSLEYAKYWSLNSTQINYSSKSLTQIPFDAPAGPDAHASLEEDEATLVDSEVDKLLGNITSVADWPNNRTPIAIAIRQQVFQEWTEAVTAREKKLKEEEEAKKKKEAEEKEAAAAKQRQEALAAAAAAAAAPPPPPPAVEPEQPPVIEQIQPDPEPAVQPPAPQPAQEPAQIVNIPNPQMKPATQFVSWPPKSNIRRCAAPAGFPEKYHVLLLQGEPTDYIVEHGQVCILGYINKSTVSSKGCLLVNNQIERILDVQFLSKSLELYIHPKSNPLSVKKDGFLRATLNIKQLRKIK